VQGYVVAAIGKELIVVEESLRALEEEFGEHFVRIHRNALVAPARVSALERDLDGNLAVVFHARNERLPVSRRLFGQVRKRLRGR
jgi:two-component system response regulator AlgR